MNQGEAASGLKAAGMGSSLRRFRTGWSSRAGACVAACPTQNSQASDCSLCSSGTRYLSALQWNWILSRYRRLMSGWGSAVWKDAKLVRMDILKVEIYLKFLYFNTYSQKPKSAAMTSFKSSACSHLCQRLRLRLPRWSQAILGPGWQGG